MRGVVRDSPGRTPGPDADEAVVTFIHRRMGFDPTPTASGGWRTHLEGHLAVAPGPLYPADLPVDPDEDRRAVPGGIWTWIDHLVRTDDDVVEWLAWHWHGHFATSVAKVRSPALMARHVDTLRRLGRSPLPELVRAVTIDGAMLIYLDGATSVAGDPNENYARELMELFTVGAGVHTEADVGAAAAALTGWVVRRRAGGEVRFVPGRHDPTSRTVLGRTVRDVDGVVAAVTGHPACAVHVAGRFARVTFGDAADPGVVRHLADAYAAGGLRVGAMMAAAAEVAAAGPPPPIVSDPVVWCVRALRATGSRPAPRAVLAGLRAAGQLPWAPPNVAGWPRDRAWLNAATVVARVNLAVIIASATPDDAPVLATGDPDELAVLLGLTDTFPPSVARTLRGLEPRHRLAVALASPQGVLL